MRGYDYLSFIGQQGFFANAELRFPLIEAMLTPVGVLGGIRGVLFANIGGAGFDGQPASSSRATTRSPTSADRRLPADDRTATHEPVFGDPVTISGFRLVDGRASYGVGLESFLLGFPLHFDWSGGRCSTRTWEDLVFSQQGGSSEFRKGKFTFWIGYDF